MGGVFHSPNPPSSCSIYRAAHEVESLSTHSRATTEQLRGAMVHYRALFDELLSDGGGAQPARS
ncbi:hypothetical protein ACH41H_35575 [Streptomyces sp. NPDC020800]|uniref:hypothetical protein n=1 Tax=Streptomyces sp. NPDC020800 TaxID=3365092 RepID=UPI003791D124